MKVQFNRPDYISWIIIPVIVILGLIAGDKTLDVQLHDTYYVIRYRNLAIITVLYFLISGIIYNLILNNNLLSTKGLIRWQLILSITGFLILMIIASITGGLTDGAELSMDWKISYTFIILIIIGLINIIFGLILMVFHLLNRF